jgi:hypothetical protein
LIASLTDDASTIAGSNGESGRMPCVDNSARNPAIGPSQVPCMLQSSGEDAGGVAGAAA